MVHSHICVVLTAVALSVFACASAPPPRIIVPTVYIAPPDPSTHPYEAPSVSAEPPSIVKNDEPPVDVLPTVLPDVRLAPEPINYFRRMGCFYSLPNGQTYEAAVLAHLQADRLGYIEDDIQVVCTFFDPSP